MKSRTLLLVCGALVTSFFCKAQHIDSLKTILASKTNESIIQ